MALSLGLWPCRPSVKVAQRQFATSSWGMQCAISKVSGATAPFETILLDPERCWNSAEFQIQIPHVPLQIASLWRCHWDFGHAGRLFELCSGCPEVLRDAVCKCVGAMAHFNTILPVLECGSYSGVRGWIRNPRVPLQMASPWQCHWDSGHAANL